MSSTQASYEEIRRNCPICNDGRGQPCHLCRDDAERWKWLRNQWIKDKQEYGYHPDRWWVAFYGKDSNCKTIDEAVDKLRNPNSALKRGKS